MNRFLLHQLDWWSLLFYLALVSFGIVNIYSSTYTDQNASLSHIYTPSMKQLFFFVFSLLCGLAMLFIRPNFFGQTALLFYLLAILALLGLFIFGTTISGARSWYVLGSFSVQPSEFAKLATCLVVSSLLSSNQTHIGRPSVLFRLIVVMVLPMSLIVLQPDPGSALIFSGFIFMFFREGLSKFFLYAIIIASLFFVTTVKFGFQLNILICIPLFLLIIYLKRKNVHKLAIGYLLAAFVMIIGYIYTVNYSFHTLFKHHHRERIEIALGMKEDLSGTGYTANQSKIAIGSGRLVGKGFMKGTQTKGGFVPEQHTDYIFSTVAEEWGFLGSLAVLMLYVCLIFRIINRTERQSSRFARVFIHSFIGLLVIHFFVNIGMTLGLLPSVGIPLPYMSYGGSNLIVFSILFFTYLNFDANKSSRF